MVDAGGLKPPEVTRAGSTPATDTITLEWRNWHTRTPKKRMGLSHVGSTPTSST